MKTILRQYSKPALSILLAVILMTSTLMVGAVSSGSAARNEKAADTNIITTDDAVTADANTGIKSSSNKAKKDKSLTGATAKKLTGYDTWYVRGDWDKDGNGTWRDHQITTSQSYSVSLDGGKDYQFVFKGNNDQFSAKTTISGTTDYNFSRNDSDAITLHTTISGTYTFKFKGMDGGNTAMQCRIEFPANTTVDTWTVAGSTGGVSAGGQKDNLFYQTWDPTLTRNDMTNTSGTTWTWSKSNVTLPAGNIACKVVKNHAWDTAYPSDNATKSVTAGTYNVTITFDSSTKAVTITATQVVKKTLTVGSVANATVKASYDGSTVGEGGTISDIPQGASVSITVEPDSGYKCTAVTSSGGGTVSGSGIAWTLAMPGANTTVSATLSTAGMKKIYFNNNYTLYAQVYAYVKNPSGEEPLGPYPGKIMTKMDNSNIWEISVADDNTKVTFTSGDMKTTGEMDIPWGTTNNAPKYTAPYNYNAPTTANGGTWGEYKKRTNEYTVTDGSTMNKTGLFTGISATLYDYFVDDEANGSWLTSIASHEANYNCTGDTNDPFRNQLNTALSVYADNTTQPKYNVTYPLYFGNNKDANKGSLFNFNQNVNNSTGLSDTSNAVTGLSGKTLTKSSPNYYKSGATNENGAPMAMFNEDFLSGENSQNKTLASIMRTSSFPVRQTTQTTYPNIYFDKTNCSWTNNDSCKVFAHFYNSDTDWKRVEGSLSSNIYTYAVPSGYSKVKFYRATSINGTWYNPIDAGAWSGNNLKYNVNSNFNGGSWGTYSNAASNSHTYYEYDSTNGTDNAFITDIDTSDKTAKINYYANSEQYVQSQNNIKGFFPFDYNNIINPTDTYPTSTLYFKVGNSDMYQNNEVYWAYFYNSDTDNAWRKVQGNPSTTKIGTVQNPGGYAHVIFVRKDKNNDSGNWNGKWNQTQNLDVPDGSNKNTTYTFYDNGGSNAWSATSGLQPNPKTNGYADATNHKAHDLGFGMKLTIPFTLEAGGAYSDGVHQVFEFSGDDDLWVFVDDKLVLDLGGAHGATSGKIDFADRTATATKSQAIGSATRNGSFASDFDNTNANTVHTMTIYYMERGMFDSNLKFGFSFHAIPNQFNAEKKVRTKDINIGFYNSNGKTGTASNMKSGSTTITNFESSYQTEEFTVNHKVGGSNIANNKSYTIGESDVLHPSSGNYVLKNDDIAFFNGQFDSGDSFTIKETSKNTNKYVYDQSVVVYDDANNEKVVTGSGDATSGYTFQFKPTTTVTGGIEILNLRARFTNSMKSHNLILSKDIINADDTDTSFTYQVLFDFDYTGEGSFNQYIAYPLTYTLNGKGFDGSNNPYVLDGDGKLTLKAGDTVVIPNIPENAKIKVVEDLADTVSGYRYDDISISNGSTDVTSSATKITKGAQFTMSTDNAYVNISNKKPDNRYTIKYIYPSYDNLYGNQSYTVSGVFTESELKTYMQLDGSGGIEFKTDELKKNFINTKSPYEDNFMQTVSFADATIVDTGEGKGWVDGNYIADATAKTKTDNQINVYFNLPYNVISDSTLVPEESGSSGRVKKINAQAVGSKKIDIFDWYVTSGKSHYDDKSGDSPVYVKAPLMIYGDVNDESTVKYFQYWSVKKLNGYGMKAAEYTRCYDYEFNLSLFMDCFIEPVYGTSWAQSNGNPNPPSTYNNYERFDPELQITGDSSKGISIAFLENSRNQYNNGGKGGKTNGAAAADTIFSDFLLSFNKVDGITQLNQLPANTKNAGIVIEAAGILDGNNSDGYNASKEYSSDTNFTKDESTRRNSIISWLQGSSSKPSGVNKSEFDVTRTDTNKGLDNKNCIQYYTSIKNRNVDGSSGNLLNTNNNRYKVFRAYAYIGDVNGSSLKNVTLSVPIYFTIYDIGKLYDLADNKS